MITKGKTLILGIGNSLLSDEGIGIHVLNALIGQDPFDATVEYLDGGTLSFTLADAIQSCDNLIVLDASELNREPGSVSVFENEAMDEFISSGNKKSPHEVSLVDVMSITLLTGHLPRRRALIGIQPGSIDWGDSPTPAVQKSIDDACAQVKRLVYLWQA